jgi:hypothetical protein
MPESRPEAERAEVTAKPRAMEEVLARTVAVATRLPGGR